MLHLAIASLNPFLNSASGLWNLVDSRNRALLALGCRVTVVPAFPRGEPLFHGLASAPYRVEPVYGGTANLPLLTRHWQLALTCRHAMMDKLQELNPDAVVVIGHHGIDWIAGAMQGRAPVLLDLQGSLREPLDRPDQRGRNRARYWVQQTILRRSAEKLWGALVVSKECADELEELRPALPAFTIPCACLASFEWPERQQYRLEWRRRLQVPPASFLLGYSGSLEAYQRLDVVLDILRSLICAGTDAALLFCTPDIPAATSLCAGLDPGLRSRVHIRSFRDGAHVRALAAADIGILLRDECPTNWTAFPNKADEYWAAGLPIVTTAALRPVARLVRRFAALGAVVERPQDALSAMGSLAPDSRERHDAIQCARRAVSYHTTLPPLLDALGEERERREGVACGCPSRGARTVARA